MSDKLNKTVRIQRPARIQTDGRGRSVWKDKVESGEFELMSTVALRKVLDSKDEAAKKALEAAAQQGREGVLARDVATGHFEIVDDMDLQEILDNDFGLPEQEKGADVVYEPAHGNGNSAEELSLVSTQALKKILVNDEEKEEAAEIEIQESGFDPYNSG